MKEIFREIKFRAESLARIEQMIAIVGEYEDQGLRMTARQLYYQFVSRDLIPNTPAEYKKLTALLTDARYAGLVDWDAIEDRGRVPEIPNEWGCLKDRVTSALANYRLPRWQTQPTYVELWVEKQALAGVLWPLAHEYHVPLMVNKGYSSASAMRESAERIACGTGWSRREYMQVVHRVQAARDRGDYLSVQGSRWLQAFKDGVKPAVILYLGDHDPSGEDMVRDIQVRLMEFHREAAKIEVRKIALTMDQIEQYEPPPNPAKMSDSRAAGYVAKYGRESWEVDALPPDVLSRLICEALKGLIDQKKMDAVLATEERDRKTLRKAVAGLE